MNDDLSRAVKRPNLCYKRPTLKKRLSEQITGLRRAVTSIGYVVLIPCRRPKPTDRLIAAIAPACRIA